MVKKADKESKKEEKPKEEKPVDEYNLQKESRKKAKSAKKALNFILVIVLLIIVAVIYLSQKGYIDLNFAQISEKFSVTDSNEQEVVIKNEVNTVTQEAISKEPASNLEKRVSTLEKDVTRLKNKVDNLKVQAPPVQDGFVQPKSINFGDNNIKLINDILHYQNLVHQINQGLPFASELDQISSILSQDDLAALTEYSKIGTPTLRHLQKVFNQMTLGLNLEDVAEDATLQEKLRALLRRFVRVKKVTDTTTPSTEGEVIAQLLKRGNVQSAVEKITILKEFNSVEKNKEIDLWVLHANAYMNTREIMARLQNNLTNSYAK